MRTEEETNDDLIVSKWACDSSAKEHVRVNYFYVQNPLGRFYTNKGKQFEEYLIRGEDETTSLFYYDKDTSLNDSVPKLSIAILDPEKLNRLPKDLNE